MVLVDVLFTGLQFFSKELEVCERHPKGKAKQKERPVRKAKTNSCTRPNQKRRRGRTRPQYKDEGEDEYATATQPRCDESAKRQAALAQALFAKPKTKAVTNLGTTYTSARTF